MPCDTRHSAIVHWKLISGCNLSSTAQLLARPLSCGGGVAGLQLSSAWLPSAAAHPAAVAVLRQHRQLNVPGLVPVAAVLQHLDLRYKGSSRLNSNTGQHVVQMSVLTSQALQQLAQDSEQPEIRRVAPRQRLCKRAMPMQRYAIADRTQRHSSRADHIKITTNKTLISITTVGSKSLECPVPHLMRLHLVGDSAAR